MGRRIGSQAISIIYDRYKNVVFLKLLYDLLVPEYYKRKIRDLLRPWNPYVRRHTTGTYVSKTLKDPVLVNQCRGWSPRGKTHQKYQHYYADDTFDAMPAADGMISPTTGNKKNDDILKPKRCPNCEETYTPESKFL